ncbi:MAG TPA: hypothetical protein VEA41_15330 [Salinarimonas sp.]|nr:hypothetical protein [Salinarimonas sp.]
MESELERVFRDYRTAHRAWRRAMDDSKMADDAYSVACENLRLAKDAILLLAERSAGE